MSYRGRCPKCSAELKATPLEVICPDGHYRAPILAYEKRWEQFDNDMVDMTKILLEDLLSYNTVISDGDNKPEIVL